MIDRYNTKEMKKVWSENNKYKIWEKVEIAVVEVLAEKGIVPTSDLDIIKRKSKFSINRILEIESTTNHDVIAFLTNLAENIGPSSRFIHMGMTSSDLLDTSLAVLCRDAGTIISKKLLELNKILIMRSKEFKNTWQIGRSHGVHAEPITFGLKLALWSEEIKRHIKRWDLAVENIAVGKISGAVGTYQHLDLDVEEKACKKLNIKAASISNQIVQRDHHAEYLNSIALIGATIEKFSIEIRHMQRTEVLEAEEFFSKGQKGSSAMPHKRNPILTERLTGMARILRANAIVGMENIALWHERDISHSSVERMIIPDSTTLLDYMLLKMIDLIKNLIIYPENMLKNLNQTKGLIYSQEVLLALVKKGLTREKAYSMVQKNAMKSWELGENFKNLILSDSTIKKYLSIEEIDELFSLEKIKLSIDKIYEKLKLC